MGIVSVHIRIPETLDYASVVTTVLEQVSGGLQRNAIEQDVNLRHLQLLLDCAHFRTLHLLMDENAQLGRITAADFQEPADALEFEKWKVKIREATTMSFQREPGAPSSSAQAVQYPLTR